MVYVLVIDAHGLWYFVIDDDDHWYPHRYPATLFNVTDSRVSSCWRVAYVPGGTEDQTIVGPEEWVTDEYFYDKLTDRCEKELSEFELARRAIEQESLE